MMTIETLIFASLFSLSLSPFALIAILALPTMEAFALIKYWRTSGGGGNTTGDSRATRNTIFDPASNLPCSDYGDDGPYFELEFTPSTGERPENEETPLNTETGSVSENTVEFEVKGPLVSLFARDSNSKKKTNERDLSKEAVHNYFKLLRPIPASGRYVQKMKFSGGGGTCAEEKSSVKSTRRNSNLQAGIEVVRKRLGKSRSTSGKVVVSPPGRIGSDRRDDSLLQQEDGIQGAILHCKRSFNASRGKFIFCFFLFFFFYYFIGSILI